MVEKHWKTATTSLPAHRDIQRQLDPFAGDRRHLEAQRQLETSTEGGEHLALQQSKTNTCRRTFSHVHLNLLHDQLGHNETCLS